MIFRRRRLGLTSRIALFFALGALALSSAVASTTYLLLQNNLLDDASQTAQAQTWRNARDIETGLEALASGTAIGAIANADVEDSVGTLLNNTLLVNNSRVALITDGDTVRSPNGLVRRNIPASLRAKVQAGEAAEIRFVRDGEPQLAVGLYIADVESEYFEIVSLSGIEDNLRSLRNVLVVVTVGFSILAALLGWFMARRSLHPIADVTQAAHAIAAGDFSTRLDPLIDPDLRGLALSFNDMVDALAARIERDERFASDVSHELRSPLMTLTASVEVLERRQSDLPEAAGQAVELLSKDIRRFRELVEDLLEISRIDAGGAVLDKSSVIVSQFLAAVIRNSRSPGTTIDFDAEDELLTTFIDKRRMGQVLANLIDNAIKYGAGVDSIRYESLSDDELEITVSDAGRGVPVADRERIFDRFTRGHGDAGRRGTNEGAGLGLSLAYEHVRLHGGVLGVRSRPDGASGAVFYVQLPSTGNLEEDSAW